MLQKLIIYLRFKHLFTHVCHNMVSGKTFFEDHEFLGLLYSQAEGWYDDLVERSLGLGQEVDLVDVQKKAAAYLGEVKIDFSNNEACFQVILKITKELCREIEVCVNSKTLSQGTIQLLGDIANFEEKNIYKLKRRLKS